MVQNHKGKRYVEFRLRIDHVVPFDAFNETNRDYTSNVYIFRIRMRYGKGRNTRTNGRHIDAGRVLFLAHDESIKGSGLTYPIISSLLDMSTKTSLWLVAVLTNTQRGSRSKSLIGTS